MGQGKPQRRRSFVLVQIRVGQLWMNAEQFLTQLGVQGLHASALHSGRSTFTRRRRRYQSNVRPSRRHWRTWTPLSSSCPSGWDGPQPAGSGGRRPSPTDSRCHARSRLCRSWSTVAKLAGTGSVAIARIFLFTTKPVLVGSMQIGHHSVAEIGSGVSKLVQRGKAGGVHGCR
jgi:hypothetical protein